MNSSSSASSSHESEVRHGDRFEFGKNWKRFLALLNDERIATAEASLRRMLETSSLEGTRFLDIGSGSGLFSLAARRLGATVHSFDFDPHSVGCTRELKARFFANDPRWTVDEASVLDQSYLAGLGQFDVVYSWGVLHHTGQMWTALDNAQRLVKPGGVLFIAIYNDQGSRSRRWLIAKRFYNWLPRPLKAPWAIVAMLPSEFKAVVMAIFNGSLGTYFRQWFIVDETRGMNKWRDIVDWVGGYPYEYAAPDEIFAFHRSKGFSLEKLVCKGAGFGCAEYVFRKVR